jgi:hypothetical protein
MFHTEKTTAGTWFYGYVDAPSGRMLAQAATGPSTAYLSPQREQGTITMQFLSLIRRTDDTVETPATTGIFGLRYLEEEATEIHDLNGCLRAIGTATHCDDEDQNA